MQTQTMEYQAPTPSFQPTMAPPQPQSPFQHHQQQYPSQQPQQHQHQPPQPLLPQQQPLLPEQQPLQHQHQHYYERPASQQQQASPFAGTDIRTIQEASAISLQEYASLQRQPTCSGGRLRAQGALAVSDLRALRAEVKILTRKAEGARWRKWALGGVVAALIPAVRHLFRRSSTSDHDISTNDTEHAFRKSKSLIARILDSVHSKARPLASIAFFVLAVVYVFQSEVSLRVGRTVAKRLKKLTYKVENGMEAVDEVDLKVLRGWRWRVLLW
ncbi:hypothetical protein F4808DRAFT_268687 [Astrocystis sublimbata]|nr:hypothetical protein F4808DRAFT_268687 [Astrocystis sublimbata]